MSQPFMGGGGGPFHGGPGPHGMPHGQPGDQMAGGEVARLRGELSMTQNKVQQLQTENRMLTDQVRELQRALDAERAKAAGVPSPQPPQPQLADPQMPPDSGTGPQVPIQTLTHMASHPYIHKPMCGE